jgi:CubicO group peptidase (beta-lactamase class C family)
MQKFISPTLIFLVIFYVITIKAQSNTKKYFVSDDKINQLISEYEVPAIGIGIIENGKISYSKVFGELQKGIPAPDNTIFNVASITKTVVTLLTLKLVEAGDWDLDEPLFHYWVDPDVANDSLHKKLTTYHVLTHQTGFVNWRWNHPTKKLTFDFEPGTKYQYSGEGFKYLRNALEKKFNKPLEQLTDSLIFKPLGMVDTRQKWDENLDESRFAAWHDTEGEKYERSFKTGVSAADDLLTTIEDYCKFGIFVMNGAELSTSLFNEMVSPQSDIKKYRSQGLGWSVIKGLPNDEYAISHGGSDYGVKTLAYFLPKSKRGLVLFTNGDNGFSVINYLTENTFDIGNTLHKCMYYRANLPEIVSVPDSIIEKYTGRYKQPDGSINLISKTENTIIISGGRWSKTIFYPEAENKFFRKEFDSQLEFIKNETGEITKMITYHDGNKYSEAERIK